MLTTAVNGALVADHADDGARIPALGEPAFFPVDPQISTGSGTRWDFVGLAGDE